MELQVQSRQFNLIVSWVIYIQTPLCSGHLWRNRGYKRKGNKGIDILWINSVYAFNVSSSLKCRIDIIQRLLFGFIAELRKIKKKCDVNGRTFVSIVHGFK